MKALVITVVLVLALVSGVFAQSQGGNGIDSWHTYTESNADCHVQVDSWRFPTSHETENEYFSISSMPDGPGVGGIIYNNPSTGHAVDIDMDFRFDLTAPICSNVTFTLGMYLSSNVPSIDGYWNNYTLVLNPSVAGDADGCFEDGELVEIFSWFGLHSYYEITGLDLEYGVQAGVTGDFITNDVGVFDNADPSHCEQ